MMFALLWFDFVGFHITFSMDTINKLNLNLFFSLNSFDITIEIENKFLFALA